MKSGLASRLRPVKALGWFVGLILALTTPSAGSMGDLRPPSEFARHNRALPVSGTPEQILVNTLLEIQGNRLDSALQHIDALILQNPNFKLAHLIRGDLLMARANPLTSFGGGAHASASGQIEDFREEARVRLQRHLEKPPAGKLPKYLLSMQAEQKHAVVVDTGKSRLYLFENNHGEPRLVSDYYVSIGKAGDEKAREGDQKTPLGVYFVTSNLPVEKLTDFYGVGAYPLNYPNEWDKRQGKNGHGIWLHGVPRDTYSRAPRASNGCVVLTNPDMTDLGAKLQSGLTPVVIGRNLEWVDPQELRSQRERFKGEIEDWRRDWESLDSNRYLSHYSRAFAADGQDFDAFSRQKRQVNAGKTSLKLTVSDMSFFQFPGKENVMVVTFKQDYRSNNLNNVMRKRQYWQLENGRWQIIYEGAV